MSKTCYLDYKKAKKIGAIVNLKEYYEKYEDDSPRQYKLLQGAPIVINIEGTYIYLDKIEELVQNVPLFISDNLRSLKYAIDDDTIDIVRYKWRNRGSTDE